MNIKNNKKRTIILIVFGILSLFGIIASFYNNSIANILFVAFYIVGLLNWIWSISKDIREYKMNNTLWNFLPSITGFLFLVAILILNYHMEQKRASPTLLKAYCYDGDFGNFNIDLKKNGNYIIESGSIFTDNYFYGTYVIEDSLITLDKPNITDFLNSDKLVIRSIPYFPIERQDSIIYRKYIVQLQNHEKTFNYQFEVKEDNRYINDNDK